jgi:hypothetical protein
VACVIVPRAPSPLKNRCPIPGEIFWRDIREGAKVFSSGGSDEVSNGTLHRGPWEVRHMSGRTAVPFPGTFGYVNVIRRKWKMFSPMGPSPLAAPHKTGKGTNTLFVISEIENGVPPHSASSAFHNPGPVPSKLSATGPAARDTNFQNWSRSSGNGEPRPMPHFPERGPFPSTWRSVSRAPGPSSRTARPKSGPNSHLLGLDTGDLH